mgnify:CR=1 FL=1
MMADEKIKNSNELEFAVFCIETALVYAASACSTADLACVIPVFA